MLVITRKTEERFVIGNTIVQILSVRGAKVRIGITAPAGTAVLREEIVNDPEIQALLDSHGGRQGVPCGGMDQIGGPSPAQKVARRAAAGGDEAGEAVSEGL